MYNETYQEYIRSILGYPNIQRNNYMESNYQPTTYTNNQSNEELENCYPEIYKVVYPMVLKACDTNTKPVTSSLIEELTNEIYLSIETDTEINVTINLNNDVGHKTQNNRTTTATASNTVKVAETQKENRGEDRQFRNRGLQDLIRILLIRELLGRPGHRPPMPPPRPPMRPPFPGGGPRPPIMPRGNEYYNLDLYE